MIVYHSLRDSFLRVGYRPGEYFEHRVVELGKKYPDTLLVQQRRGFSRLELDDATFLQVNVYAVDTDKYADELFFDPQINWHRQQFGMKGLIGAAGLHIQDVETAFVTLIQSDLMQQIHRAGALRRYKSMLENQFRTWPRITLDAVLNAACRCGLRRVFVPTAQTVASLLRGQVNPRLFQRIYDEPAAGLSPVPQRHNGHDYWRIDLSPSTMNRAGRYEPERPDSGSRGRPRVCLLHDIEEDIDTPVPSAECRLNLERMLAAERRRGIKGTYNILGTIYPRAAPPILRDGHDIGFHSFDHDPGDTGQLPRVREVDLQVKGYRPPQSRITGELTASNLAYWNFEWLVSSARSLSTADCFVDRDVAHIPVDIDDYALHTGRLTYSQWREHILAAIGSRDFYAFSVHDCYADAWIESYDELLDAISHIAEFRTCDEISGELFIERAGRREGIDGAEQPYPTGEG